MLIKCRHCKKEFDKPSHRNQHEKDAHKDKGQPMNNSKAREDFEAFVSSQGVALNYKGDGQYGFGVQLAWEAWQAALQRDGWVSVKDRLPEIEVERHSWKESKRVLVWVNYQYGGPYAAFAVLDNSRKWVIDGHNGNWTKHVTHWMPFSAPIPAAPSESNQ